jgi:colicin import membrane protein
VESPPKPSPAEIELREKIRKQKEEEEARHLEEKKAVEAEKRRLEEERRAEEEAKRLEQEKLKREEEARRLEEQKQLEERSRAEELRREEERRERAAAVERERQQQEAQRKQREADEAKRRAEAAARAAQQKLIDDWKARIQAKIKGRVVVPANIQGNPEARFDVVLLPGGEVLSASLKKSSGVAAYDAAVERAIMAAQPLPVPTETDLFQENFRELALVFRPKD